MQIDLKQMIERASTAIEIVFVNTGVVYPMWDAVTEDGRQLLIPLTPENMDDKDGTATVIRQGFAKERVVSYVYITEAWTAFVAGDTEADRKALAGGSLEHYPGRDEVVTFVAEDASGVLQANRRIIRGEGKPTLGPLEYMPCENIAGRFIGMLPRPANQPLQ